MRIEIKATCECGESATSEAKVELPILSRVVDGVVGKATRTAKARCTCSAFTQVFQPAGEPQEPS